MTAELIHAKCSINQHIRVDTSSSSCFIIRPCNSDNWCMVVPPVRRLSHYCRCHLEGLHSKDKFSTVQQCCTIIMALYSSICLI